MPMATENPYATLRAPAPGGPGRLGQAARAGSTENPYAALHTSAGPKQPAATPSLVPTASSGTPASGAATPSVPTPGAPAVGVQEKPKKAAEAPAPPPQPTVVPVPQGVNAPSWMLPPGGMPPTVVPSVPPPEMQQRAATDPYFDLGAAFQAYQQGQPWAPPPAPAPPPTAPPATAPVRDVIANREGTEDLNAAYASLMDTPAPAPMAAEAPPAAVGNPYAALLGQADAVPPTTSAAPRRAAFDELQAYMDLLGEGVPSGMKDPAAAAAAAGASAYREASAADTPQAATAEAPPPATAETGDVPPPAAAHEDSPADPWTYDAYIKQNFPWLLDTGSYVTANGTLKWLPDDDSPEQFNAFLQYFESKYPESHAFSDPGVRGNLQNLVKWVNRYLDPTSTKTNKEWNRIERELKQLQKQGVNIDISAVFESFTPGFGKPKWYTPQGHDPNLPPGEDPNEPPPNQLPSGKDAAADLAWLNDLEVPDFVRQHWNDPDFAAKFQVLFDLISHAESRADRQTAIDTFTREMGLLDNDPATKQLREWLEKGPQFTYDDETIAKMKAGAAETFGNTISSMDNALRERAAMLGIPVTDLASIEAQARARAGGDLAAMNREIDILVAEKRMQDLNNFYAQLLSGQAQLLAPKYQGVNTLTGLIAGAPGFAQTGNPYMGNAEYQMASDAASEHASGYARRMNQVGEGAMYLNFLSSLAGGGGGGGGG